MELGYGADVESFRAELREWLEANVPDEIRHATDEWTLTQGVPDWSRKWQATLFEAGWLVPQWPRSLGGRDASPVQTLVYFEEMARFKAPRTLNFQGLNIVAPSLRDFGTPEQIERWLVPTLRADVIWCIGMSEPGAGSDLGGLTTRAELDGDEFVVNGQKVWTSSAHHADWCMLYCRTDPSAPKHAGISVLVVDMKTPGVEPRPFKQLTEAEDFAEVFFTDARVPRANLVGELHGGWRVTMGSLAHERAGLWVQNVASLERMVEQLIEAAPKDDPAVRGELAKYYQDVATLKALGYKGFASYASKQGAPEHSLLKLAAAELYTELCQFAVRRLGLMDSRWPMALFASFAGTIAGGTSEIQRNIIAERVLGLPRAGAARG